MLRSRREREKGKKGKGKKKTEVAGLYEAQASNQGKEGKKPKQEAGRSTPNWAEKESGKRGRGKKNPRTPRCGPTSRFRCPANRGREGGGGGEGRKRKSQEKKKKVQTDFDLILHLSGRKGEEGKEGEHCGANPRPLNRPWPGVRSGGEEGKKKERQNFPNLLNWALLLEGKEKRKRFNAGRKKKGAFHPVRHPPFPSPFLRCPDKKKKGDPPIGLHLHFSTNGGRGKKRGGGGKNSLARGRRRPLAGPMRTKEKKGKPPKAIALLAFDRVGFGEGRKRVAVQPRLGKKKERMALGRRRPPVAWRMF